MKDMHNKWRHPSHKVTEEMAAKIRSMYVRGSAEFGQVALAHKFGLSQTKISKLVRN